MFLITPDVKIHVPGCVCVCGPYTMFDQIVCRKIFQPCEKLTHIKFIEEKKKSAFSVSQSHENPQG